MRFVDADKIVLRVRGSYDDEGMLFVPLADVIKSIAQTPTADVQEVRHGRWIQKTDSIRFTHWVCSECGNVEDVKGKKYCSECGAKMDR